MHVLPRKLSNLVPGQRNQATFGAVSFASFCGDSYMHIYNDKPYQFSFVNDKRLALLVLSGKMDDEEHSTTFLGSARGTAANQASDEVAR